MILDRNWHCVRKDGKQIELTHSEWVVLEALASREGWHAAADLRRAIAPEQVDARLGENPVRTTVRRLRAKVGRGSIIAKNGHGYALRPGLFDEPNS